MKRIYRYLMGALARGYLLVAGSLLALFGLFDFMEQADDIGEASFGTGDAVAVVALSLPARLLDLSPFIALLGVVYGLSTFVRSHELIAMRAAGITPLRLAVMSGVATAGFFAVLAGVELAGRPMYQQAEILQMTETSRDGVLFSREGIWIEHEGLFVNIESLARGGRPSGIRLYDFGDDTVLDRYLHADRADLPGEGSWILRDVVEKRYGADGGIDTGAIESLPWDPPWQQTTALYELPLESLTLTELNAHRLYLAEEKRPNGIYAMEFWRRLLLPASGITFALFAAPFVLGVGPRASMGGAVSLGVANALVMFLVQQIGTNAIFIATGSPLLAVAAPIVAVLGIAAALIRRVNGAPR
jgi:lipopolysaccharide export system permease protein